MLYFVSLSFMETPVHAQFHNGSSENNIFLSRPALHFWFTHIAVLYMSVNAIISFEIIVSLNPNT